MVLSYTILQLVANDWCTDNNGELIKDKVECLMNSYSHVRNLDNKEKVYWNHALVTASLRFYL